ncbi:MAG: glycosyltransferase [Acidobacteria bacterium]|nr:glycosyltransferase [Acidobacteriota bacterium]
MSGFPRFDAEGATLLSDRDIKRRWAKFHDSIRSVSGNVLQRVIGRMLGEDTLRYKTARFFGRPLLRLVRSLRKQPAPTVVEPVVVQSQKVAAQQRYFPINYRIPRHILDPTLVEVHQQFTNVSTFTLDESVESANDSVLALNELLATSSSEWLFVVDASVSEANRSVTLAALLSVATPNDDVVFADENGPNPFTPILKSAGVGPHTLLSYNTVGRPALLRRTTLARIGGFSLDASWVFEHDAYLRLKESGAHFRHVTAVLPAGRPDVAFDASHVREDTCRVVRTALERRGMHGEVTPGELGTLVHWRLDAPQPEPSIDIVIPTRDRIDLVRQCIDAIEAKTTYSNYDIIILDNDSIEPETLDYFAKTKYRVVPCPGPFNYAHIVNRGISHSSAQYVVTLNNDTILVTPDWLERMVGLASQPDISIVGACLLDQDGRREHESIVIAPYPQHLRTDSNYPHPDEFTLATRDVAAVTGAVQMVRRELWEALGGMDEDLKVVMNDVDICLRSQDDGRHVVYTPDVRLYHHVSSSRGDLDPLDDRNRFIRRWDIFGTFKDPYFPESLLLLGETVYYRHQWD